MLPPVKPPPRPFKPSSKSHDDLDAVSALDEAEARLRAAKMLADDEARRADDEEKQKIELQKELDALRATQTIIIQTPEAKPEVKPPGNPISLSPQAVTLRGKHWKVTIPLALIIATTPLIWTLVSDYLQLRRDFKTQTDTYGAQAKRIEEVNTFAHEVAKSNEDLREKMAELSGYLAGILPKAGVKVPGAEPGATFVDIVSDPLPIGEAKKRQRPIVVHNPVPAPTPRSP
jgi:hypothetical protein